MPEAIKQSVGMPPDGHGPDPALPGAMGTWSERVWRAIPNRFTKAFVLALTINLVVFAYLLIQHPLGNHDLARMPWIEYLNQVSVGRWFCFILYLLVGHAQLPVVNQLLAIVFHIASGMAAALYWRRADSTRPLLLAALTTSLVPFVLGHFYFSYQALCFGAAQLLAIGGLIAAARATPAGVGLGSLLILFALASYQPVLSVVLVALILYVLLNLSDRRARSTGLSSGRLIRTSLAPGGLAILAAGLLYRGSLAVCRWFGLLEWKPYQLREVSLGHLPSRLLRSLEVAFNHLILPQPYLPLFIKLMLLALLILAAWAVLRRLGTRNLAWGPPLIVAAIWATKSFYPISPISFYYAFRLSGGLTILYVFAVLLALETPGRRIRALAATLVAGVLLLFAYQDLVHQALMVRGNQHDLALANRILYRLESLRGLDPDESYNLIVIGDLPHYAAQRYSERAGTFRYPADFMDDHSMVPPWEPELAFEMLGSTVSLQTPWKGHAQDIQRQQAYLYALQHSRWPARGSVALLNSNLIVVVLQDNVAELAREYDRLASRLLDRDRPDAAQVVSVHEEIAAQLDFLCARQERRARHRMDWLGQQLSAARADWLEAVSAGRRPDARMERLFWETEEGLRSARSRLDGVLARPAATTADKLDVLQKLLDDTIPALRQALRATREPLQPASHHGG